ncbi:hypothetical protein RFI_16497 [Reticulomyxa filosa]|uniref:Uncharacterized protein n=1 Tax=Reticulomyxa filosa TaxID=46433 RepID=X6N5Y0_RETFI|nr:hypothetical protein RFI_16497 [Reticulomyxa filosa]|eukprot:ETO20722.1 hypothetical protein RFI_16497 [Reticulomyxa filosa]
METVGFDLETVGKENVSLVVYDFDQTITCDHLYRRLDGGSTSIFTSSFSCLRGGQLDELSKMSNETLLEVFGGENRLRRLHLHFERVKSRAIIAIVSYGYTCVIRKALERAGLSEHWNNCTIVGCDSKELTRAGGQKAKIIEQLKRRYHLTSDKVKRTNSVHENKKKTKALFVDDDPINIHQANTINCSHTLGIIPRRGMTEKHMIDIEQRTGVWQDCEDNVSHSNPQVLVIPSLSPTDMTLPSSSIAMDRGQGNCTIGRFKDTNKIETCGDFSCHDGRNSKANNTTPRSRTDWSRFAVTVPKYLEKIWDASYQEHLLCSFQHSPVVLINSDTIDSDNDDIPTLKLPPEMSSLNHI